MHNYMAACIGLPMSCPMLRPKLDKLFKENN